MLALVVAAALAIVAQFQSSGRNLLAWAVILIALVLLAPVLR